MNPTILITGDSRGIGGGTAITVQADVSVEAEVLAMFAKIDAKLGRLGDAGQYVDYAASKGAIDTFTAGLAQEVALEVALEGIRVNAVRPGIIDTEIHASSGQPDRALRLAPLVPLQRPGRADEVAQSILWLLSDAASCTTDSLLDVAGGR